MNKKLYLITAGFVLLSVMSVFSQEITNKVSDTLKVKLAEEVQDKEEKNRNVMLNAANNTGPRDVNIGLPSNVGGITIQENDLPVVYFYWPELPTRTWRQSISLGKTGLLKMGEMAIISGDLGFAVNSYTRLATDKHEIIGNLFTSNYGWLKGDVNISGPLSKGWSYTIGVYQNYDPNSYDLKFTNFSDKTQIYRAGFTKRFNNAKGEISLLYKYASSASLTNYSVFKYKGRGRIEELPNFRVGLDSYIVRDGILGFKDFLSGDPYTVNMANGNKIATTSHNIDLVGNYQLKNDWFFRFSTRFHEARAVALATIPIGILESNKEDFTYKSDGSVYDGPVQSVLAFHSPNTPTTTLAGRFEFLKRRDNHNWRIGFTESYYNVEKFLSNRTFYYQEVNAAPQKLLRRGSTPTDNQGFYNYNAGAEYHNGFENKITGYFSDDWIITKDISLTYGTNLRYHKMKGDYYSTPRIPNGILKEEDKRYFDHDWFHLGLSLNAIYKLTDKMGFLADFIYTEKNGQLENYSGDVVPNFDKTKSPLGAFGIYFNHDKFSIVSQASYLTRNNYQTRLNLVNPSKRSQSEVITVNYDIETVGWTTDIVANLFKGFTLHYLITFQNPVYKNYNFDAFGNSYSYNDKNVLEISKVLMEIDPNYLYKNFRAWASFRYFSRQFANQTNALYFEARWETFAGLSYKLNKNIDLGLSAVNIFNQNGAKGTIQGAELITNSTLYNDSILVGSYIRPFTLEASLCFRF